jgi:hypothetical protein
MPSFPAFKNKIKIEVNAKLTFHPNKKCQFSTNFNFNFISKSWETAHNIILVSFYIQCQLYLEFSCIKLNSQSVNRI